MLQLLGGLLLGLRRLLEGFEELGIFALQIVDHVHVFTLYALNIDLLDMHQAQQFTHRARHIAAAFVT